MLPPSSRINHAETRIQRIQVPIQVPILKPVYVEEPYPVYVPIPGPNRLPNFLKQITPDQLTKIVNIKPQSEYVQKTSVQGKEDSEDEEDNEEDYEEDYEEDEEEEEIIENQKLKVKAKAKEVEKYRKQEEDKKQEIIKQQTILKKKDVGQSQYAQTLTVPGQNKSLQNQNLNNSYYRIGSEHGRTYNDIKLQSSNEIRQSSQQEKNDTSILIKSINNYGQNTLNNIQNPMASLNPQASFSKLQNTGNQMIKSKYQTLAQNQATLGNTQLAKSQMENSNYR